MPTPTPATSIANKSSNNSGSASSSSSTNTAPGAASLEDEDDGRRACSMSPEEEASASPPAAVIAGAGREDARVSSPPTASKFLHDDTRGCSERDATATAKVESSDGAKRDPASDDSCSDVEKFDGKIVYNPDGSAYIIEDSELSEEDAVDLPIGDGCIVDGRGVSLSQFQVFPQIANAFYVSRNASLYNALYGGGGSAAAGYSSLLQDKKIVPEIPVMHSYRVYTVRDNRCPGDGDKCAEDAKGSDRGDTAGDKHEKYSGKDCSSVPVKPILMCFICKLSFGYAKSFVAHAMGDHNVCLLEDEKDILGHKNASAIIQCVGKNKEPLVSFLEPLSAPVMAAPLLEKRGDLKQTPQLVPKDPKLLFPDLGSRSSPSGSNCDGKSEFGSVDLVKGHSESASAESPMVHRRESDTNSSPLARDNVQNFHVPETSVSLPQNGSSSNNVNNNSFSSISSGSNDRMTGAMNNVMDLTRKSPISASAATSGCNTGRSSVSPGASPSPGSTLSPLLSSVAAGMGYPPQPPPNFLTGTTIGVCPEHIGGRPSGADCPKCELILASSRLGGGVLGGAGGGGPLAGMHSRNSCKTLKCPKCNWHYKYQETLEIHMKEKHPETETSCIYCIAGQPHPRLARGETYTCGYKPYRCEVCNYSTTTKGNLSIHMQSDKHLNNMQELQNGGVPNSGSGDGGPGSQQTPPPHHKMVSPHHHHHHHGTPLSSTGVGAQSHHKPKPTFRCDVCNYETNVARNLRIHMTSEKHTHNMMVLQQNVKHMQTLSALHQHGGGAGAGGFESLLHFHPGLTLPGDKPPPHTEAALADMAYNQALLIQMMAGGQLPPHMPPELAPHMDMGLNPETMEPPPEPADPNPAQLFQCCVCNAYATDSLEALSLHLSADRTKIREQEILAVVAGHYVCKLCTYKTNLKANFQLHCKTDKHLQRLQHVNHVKEGGTRNEWKLKYLASPGGVQVRCHACDYYTNSAHKLQLHAAGQRHEASCLLFMHLREAEAAAAPGGGERIYHCALCGFSGRAKLSLLQHVRTVKHLQMEQLHQLQRRSEGKDMQADIGEVFQVIGQPSHPFPSAQSDASDNGELLQHISN